MRRACCVLALACASLACHPIGAPNLLLVTLDSARADRLNGSEAVAGTPTLAALRARGTVFERAFASSPLSLPSHATLLTGLDPLQHGVRDEGRFVADAALETLAERLVRRGYATAAFVGGLALHRIFGLDQGFAVYDDAIDPPLDAFHFEAAGRPARDVTDAALAWLDAEPRDPFFVWVQYHDLHEPGRSSGARDAATRYDEALGALDAQLARLLAGVERASGQRETLIVLVGAHGEALGAHGERTHGVLAYDATLHVPLVAAGPGFAAGARSGTFVRCEDVAATLLAAAGDAPEPGQPLQQRSAAADDDERAFWFETLHPESTLGWTRVSGVRTARWKYIAEPAPPELYDVRADPSESHDLLEAETEVAKRLAARHASLRSAAPPPRAPSPAQRAARVALVGFLPGPAAPAAEAPHPRRALEGLIFVERAAALAARGRVADGIQSLELLARAPALRSHALVRLTAVYLLAGRTRDAARAARDLVASSGSAYARVSLAMALLADGRTDDALALLDALESREGALSSRALLVRGQAWLQAGQPAAAERAARILLRRLPHDDAAVALASAARTTRAGADAEMERLRAELERRPDAPLIQTRLALARLLAEAGRDDEAAAVLDAAPQPHIELWLARARLEARRGDARSAAELYERVLDAQPAAQHVLPELAALYERLGRTDEALRLHDRLVRLRPDDASTLAARGAALARAGREDEAERDLARAVALRPDLAAAHLELARIYHRRGDPRGALHAEQAARAGAGVPEPVPPGIRAHPTASDPGQTAPE